MDFLEETPAIFWLFMFEHIHTDNNREGLAGKRQHCAARSQIQIGWIGGRVGEPDFLFRQEFAKRTGSGTHLQNLQLVSGSQRINGASNERISLVLVEGNR